VQHLEKRAEAMWRTGTIWSFRNEDKVPLTHCIVACPPSSKHSREVRRRHRSLRSKDKVHSTPASCHLNPCGNVVFPSVILSLGPGTQHGAFAPCRVCLIVSCVSITQVYGSPMFDRAMTVASGHGVDPMPGLLIALQSAPLPFGRRGGGATGSYAAAAAAAAAAGGVPAGGGSAAALANGSSAANGGGSGGGRSQSPSDEEVARRREQEASDAALARQLQRMADESP